MMLKLLLIFLSLISIALSEMSEEEFILENMEMLESLELLESDSEPENFDYESERLQKIEENNNEN